MKEHRYLLSPAGDIIKKLMVAKSLNESEWFYFITIQKISPKTSREIQDR